MAAPARGQARMMGRVEHQGRLSHPVPLLQAQESPTRLAEKVEEVAHEPGPGRADSAPDPVAGTCC